ncbi:YlxR family protein [Demequina maris]|uniref:YlxR family protein n=1 Tax=Demequina maris TaxID=1638982 RepID=UPI0009E33C91
MEPRDPSRDVGAPAPVPQEPVRTCVGCRGRGSRSVLVRVAFVDGRAVVDERRILPGRGAWLHPDPQCLAQALRRRALPRALRVAELDVTGLEVG